ncbi:hypothetical protein HBI88_194580 [Parastagonospora nodorum]|nr:hypothetical protein HBI94_248000 [Parastagonospora nodorum]KAH5846176.1 hypothetical protein HBI92_245240 [Parastagonospora nodorum]KAH5895226.1 hypothetical protein HBI89_193640 [Parastagonospora nodorum]KAH5909893.1 hypothetical protein HBI88_194580 [Parastagonospora nodorum]KAH5928602.1 hypothetical protein HBI86_207430 [Parastagonospora nodorum]
MLINLLELSLLLARCGNEQYYRSAFNTEYEKSSTLLLNPQGARKRADSPRARILINPSAVLPRARTLINPSAVLYEQSAAQPGLPAEVGNMDLDFVPSVAFIPNVYIADSLRARTLINLSAVLYEQAAARTGLPAEVSNIDLNFVPGVAFIPNVHIADSLRARTPINPSAVLYEQAAAQTSLPAEVSNISPRARTLINPSAVLYEQVGIIDLDFVPGVAFDAMGNVELTGDLLGDADRVNNNNNNERTALLAKRIKTDEDRKKSTHRQGFNGSSSLELQKTSTRNNRNNLNIIVTDPTGREFGRVDMKSLTGFKFYKGKNIQLLRPVFELQRYDYYNPQDSDSLTQIQFTQQGPTPREPGSIYVLRSVDEIRADVANVFDTVVSKSDKVPTREPSSHIKTELYPHQKQALYFMLRDNSRKFYRLVITGEDTHYKQIIKKAYIMSPERASLILFIT